jgi:hypothetical protein
VHLNARVEHVAIERTVLQQDEPRWSFWKREGQVDVHVPELASGRSLAYTLDLDPAGEVGCVTRAAAGAPSGSRSWAAPAAHPTAREAEATFAGRRSRRSARLDAGAWLRRIVGPGATAAVGTLARSPPRSTSAGVSRAARVDQPSGSPAELVLLCGRAFVSPCRFADETMNLLQSGEWLASRLLGAARREGRLIALPSRVEWRSPSADAGPRLRWVGALRARFRQGVVS